MTRAALTTTTTATPNQGVPMPKAEINTTTTATPNQGVPMPRAESTTTTTTTPNPGVPMLESVPDTQRTPTPVRIPRATLRGLALDLRDDELRILTRIAERLKCGPPPYRWLRAAGDPRTFRSKEARLELEDAILYLTRAWLRAASQEVSR
jgi:hypothetical protein